MKVKWGESVEGNRLGQVSVLGFERERKSIWTEGVKGVEEERVTERGRRGVMTKVKSRESDGEEDGGCREAGQHRDLDLVCILISECRGTH